MNKWSKRLTAGVIAATFTGVLSMQYVGYVSAMEGLAYSEIEYVQSAVCHYLRDLSPIDGEVSVSDAIPFYNFDTGEICASEYVVYYLNDVAGVLFVGEIQGEYYSSFRTSEIEVLESAVAEGKKIAVGRYNDDFLIYDGAAFYNTNNYKAETSIKSNECTAYSSIPDICFQQAKVKDFIVQEIETKDIELTPLRNENTPLVISHGSTVFDIKLDVECVKNENYYGGLCWAASIAAKHNYVDQSDNNWTAFQVDTMVRSTLGITDGSAIGTPSNIQYGLRMLGMLSSYKAETLTATQIYAELSWDNPVLIDVFRPNAGHNLIISGLEYYDDNSATYIIVDSNFSSPIEVFVSSNVTEDGTKFIYANENSIDSKTNSSIAPSYGNNPFPNWRNTYSFKFK